MLLASAADIPAAHQPIRELLDACRDDPARFHEEVLGRQLWHKQVEVCKAIARSPVTVVPAGRAVGKSFLLAGTVLWWLYTRPMSLVITTGPDHRQVVSVLWKEIRRALRPRFEQGRRVSPRLNLGSDHLTEGYTSPQRLTVKMGTDWGALGFAAQYEEGFSGQHAGDLLVIVDEASGVTPPIWSAIHGLAASRLVVVGNPIRYDCHFRELHDLAVKGSETIATVGISSLEVARRQEGLLSRRHGLAVVPEPDARDPRRGVALVAVEHPGHLPRPGVGPVPARRPGSTPARGRACPATSSGSTTPRDRPSWAWISAAVSAATARWSWSATASRSWRSSPPSGTACSTRPGTGSSPSSSSSRGSGAWRPERVIYDKAGLGRSFGSYLAGYGLDGAVGYFGAGKGGKLYVNRRTANAFAIRRRLDPHRENHVPFYCGGHPEWPPSARSWPSSARRPWSTRRGRSSSGSKTRKSSPPGSSARPTCSMRF